MLALGYYNEIVDELWQACTGTTRGVPWLRGGLSRAEFEELLVNNPPAPIAQQGPTTASKVKRMLQQLLSDGKGGIDGVYEWYTG
jgi:hypothetical protein